MKISKLVVCALVLVFAAIQVFASNITVEDDNFRTPRIGTGQGGEDEETEPGMVLSQDWDLEGFFFENNELSLVGGYNFKTGFDGMKSGDIFIATSRPTFGDVTNTSTDGNRSVQNTYGFNYVLDLNFADMTYDIFSLGGNTTVITTFYAENQGSNPWKYKDGGTLEKESLPFQFAEDVQDTGFTGAEHYSLTGFDLSLFLNHGEMFYSHFTMQCGNDNLMGRGTVVPEPTTMVLLGSGLVGLALHRRRTKK